MDNGKPLAAASKRLQKPRGRPRKADPGHAMGHTPDSAPSQEPVKKGNNKDDTSASQTIVPQLWTKEQVAVYLNVSIWTVGDMVARGALHPVRFPMKKVAAKTKSKGNLKRERKTDTFRRLLFDKKQARRGPEARRKGSLRACFLSGHSGRQDPAIQR